MENHSINCTARPAARETADAIEHYLKLYNGVFAGTGEVYKDEIEAPGDVKRIHDAVNRYLDSAPAEDLSALRDALIYRTGGACDSDLLAGALQHVARFAVTQPEPTAQVAAALDDFTHDVVVKLDLDRRAGFVTFARAAARARLDSVDLPSGLDAPKGGVGFRRPGTP